MIEQPERSAGIHAASQPTPRAGARGWLAACAAILLFAVIHWLRAPEPPGYDQSLFTYYGHWLGRGLVLYRDLWDSKPPGIFFVYALAERAVGITAAARALDALAAALAGVLAYRLLRALRADRLSSGAAAAFVALLPSAPPFGGPLVAGQAEALQTPLLLAALLAARSARPGRFALAGAFLGCATLLKLEAVVFVPLLGCVTPRAAWRRPALPLALVGGFALPVSACVGVLALQHALPDAVAAVLAYPRAYWAEIASRSPLGAGLERGAVRLGRGLPGTSVLALLGISAGWRAAGPRLAVVWFVLAVIATAGQRLMSGYHLLLFVPPLAVLARSGVARTGVLFGRLWPRAARGAPWAVAAWAVLALAIALPATMELRLWSRHYAPHVALRRGFVSEEGFLQALGGPGPAWAEAGHVVAQMEPTVQGAGTADDERGALLVWGFAPAVYLRSGRPPATRFVFHQTLLVTGSPLSRRWPGTATRRARLLWRMRYQPPQFVVVVSGDRSGLEPVDSRTELGAFPELEQILATDYRQRGATRSYALLERRHDE